MTQSANNQDVTQVLTTSNSLFTLERHRNGNASLVLTPEGNKQLIAVFNRALNCWDEAPTDTKEICDLLTDGRILQPVPRQTA